MTAERPPTDAPEASGSTAAFEFALWSLSDQMRSIEASDTKVSATLSASVAMAGFFAAVVAFVLDGSSAETRVAALVAAAVIILLLLATVYCFFRAYGDKAWAAGPTTERLVSTAQQYRDDVVREWLTSEIMESVDENAVRLADKTLWSERTLKTAVAQATAVTVGIVVVTASAVLL